MNEKTKKQLVGFFEKNKAVKIKKGQIILKPGEKISNVLFEKSGYVRVYSVTKDGKEVTLPILKALFLISLTNVLLNKENKYFVQAISPMEVWMTPEKEFIDFVKQDDDLYKNLVQSVLADFLDLTNNLQKLIFGDAYTKVASLICSHLEKFGELKDGETVVDFKTPHRILASMTGLTRETVTLQILKLQKEGFLYNKGRKIVVKDMVKLSEIAKI
ncbi:MAG: Crp/Fnr family transcriptional regulator [Candidatus Shapirobacteria bacterium]